MALKEEIMVKEGGIPMATGLYAGKALVIAMGCLKCRELGYGLVGGTAIPAVSIGMWVAWK